MTTMFLYLIVSFAQDAGAHNANLFSFARDTLATKGRF
jgi:hypothetical protein